MPLMLIITPVLLSFKLLNKIPRQLAHRLRRKSSARLRFQHTGARRRQIIKRVAQPRKVARADRLIKVDRYCMHGDYLWGSYGVYSAGSCKTDEKKSNN